jgi:hypothetical protein
MDWIVATAFGDYWLRVERGAFQPLSHWDDPEADHAWSVPTTAPVEASATSSAPASSLTAQPPSVPPEPLAQSPSNLVARGRAALMPVGGKMFLNRDGQMLAEVSGDAITVNQSRFDSILGCFEVDGPFGAWPHDAWVVSDGRTVIGFEPEGIAVVGTD